MRRIMRGRLFGYEDTNHHLAAFVRVMVLRLLNKCYFYYLRVPNANSTKSVVTALIAADGTKVITWFTNWKKKRPRPRRNHWVRMSST
jgi:hypothetical protein